MNGWNAYEMLVVVGFFSVPQSKLLVGGDHNDVIYGVGTARRARVPRGAVLNALPVDASGTWRIGLEARRLVTVAGTELDLTPREYELLKQMLASPGRVLTRGRLLRGNIRVIKIASG